jgi:hypothetical protein
MKRQKEQQEPGHHSLPEETIVSYLNLLIEKGLVEKTSKGYSRR